MYAVTLVTCLYVSCTPKPCNHAGSVVAKGAKGTVYLIASWTFAQVSTPHPAHYADCSFPLIFA